MTNYIDFTYNGESLSHYNGFIVNGGEDLTFFNPSKFSHDFVSPKFGNQSYFIGTNRENREFTIPIFLKEITMVNYRLFLKWLNPDTEGILFFDYNINYGYNVKVNSLSEGKFTVLQNCVNDTEGINTYNIELTVGFITKNDWTAKCLNINNITWDLTNNTKIYYESGTSGISIFEISKAGSDYTFTNNLNVDNYLIFDLSNITALSITYNSIEYYSYNNTSINATLYTEYGFCIEDTTNNFINISSESSIKVPANSSIILTITYTGTLTVLPTFKEII